MFSQTTDYALRSVAHLATCANHESTLAAVSEAIKVNSPYLRKVISKLRKAGLVAAQRGKGGGIRLCVDPSQITLLDVVNATDPIQRIKSCPLGLPDHMELCPLHSDLDAAIAHITKVLGSRTIEELLAVGSNTSQCGFPQTESLYQL